MYFLNFSYDIRGGSFSKTATHWKDKNRLGERAHFRTVQDPAILAINNVQENDEGNYRCRVDFFRSPTRNAKVYLMIVGECLPPFLLFYDFKRYFAWWCSYLRNRSWFFGVFVLWKEVQCLLEISSLSLFRVIENLINFLKFEYYWNWKKKKSCYLPIWWNNF